MVYVWMKKHYQVNLSFILNGNLLLEKRQNQFKKWLNELNKAWDLKIPMKSFNCIVKFH